MSFAGYVVLAAALVILGYLVPTLVRRRQALGDSCVDDRFSSELRVVATASGRPAPASSRSLPSTTALVAAPVRSPRAEETAVNRPTGMADRRAAQEARRVASVRAALAARRAEQAAAARRRLVLTVALVLVSAVAWTAVGVAGFQVLLAAFPTLVLGVVLWFGVRTARAERAEWAQVPQSLTQPRAARAAGPTYSASQLRSHLPAAGEATGGLSWQVQHAPVKVEETTDEAAPIDDAVAETVSGLDPVEVAPVEAAPVGSWTPQPVPVPTYTLKPVAQRREAAPYEAPAEQDGTQQEASVLDVQVGDGIDLHAVLARRRAVGA